MRNRKMNWAIRLYVLGFILLCCVPLCLAEEENPAPQTAESSVSQEGEKPSVSFETEGDFFMGYRWVSTGDSLIKAAEYIYPNSSASFGLNLLSCPLPYRYHVNGEFVSKYDFYSDAGFAYKDLILFRDILVGIHHNLDHYNVDSVDLDVKYYKNFTSNLMSLRLKTPDFPLHGFINHRHVEKDGTIQQRFLLGYFDSFDITSRPRDIDWKSNAIKLGTNGHFGPLELEYAYDQARFDPNGNNILYDDYPEFVSTDPDILSRDEDAYPHNVIPESESSGHSIKVHSSYTGGIVTAASVSTLSQENNYSGTESSTWKGAFDFSWIPDPVFGFFFKYRHKDVDMDNPSEVNLSGITPGNNYTYTVRPGISYNKDVFSLSSRYKALPNLSLFAKYEFSHLERDELSEWVLLPERSNIHTIDLTAHARPLDRVKVTAKYEYKNFDEPSYNSTPDYSNKLRLTTNYTPTPTLNLYLEYILSSTSRDSLLYLNSVNSNTYELIETGNRDGRFDQFLASFTTQLTPKASLTLSWFYFRWETEQDLAYGKWADEGVGDLLPYIDAGVSNCDKSNTLSLSLHYMPWEDFTLTADLSYTLSEGTTAYGDVVGDDPSYSLSEFSNLEATETALSLALAKRLAADWEIGLRSFLDIYNDKKTGDLLDGKVFINTISLKRYF